MSSLSEDGTGTLLGNSTARAGADISSPLPVPTNNNIGSYILPNSRSSNPNTLRMSPSVDGDDTNRGFNLSNIPAASDSNYLEPISTPTANRILTRFHSIGDGTVSSIQLGVMEPISPGSPNSINNILEVTSLNPLPNNVNNNGVSNIYQEFPLRMDNANYRDTATKKLSNPDIPPVEQAPSANFSAQIDVVAAAAAAARSPTITNAINSMIAGGNNNVSNENLPLSLPISPTQSANDSCDMPTYVNVTPGEISSSASTPKFVLNDYKQNLPFRNNGNNNNNNNYLADSAHCYENLEPSEVRPILLRNQQRRQSRTDLLAKSETMASTPTDKTAEAPLSPTNRKVNYIVLDLDQTHSQTNPTAMTPNGTNIAVLSTTPIVIAPSDVVPPQTPSANSSPTKAVNVSNSAGPNATVTVASPMSSSTTTHSISSLLPPESPKKGVFDYATIDFNKTNALSNSITPTVDCEGSRKTRHSSTVVPVISNTTPVCSSTNSHAPPSHSNSISD